MKSFLVKIGFIGSLCTSSVLCDSTNLRTVTPPDDGQMVPKIKFEKSVAVASNLCYIKADFTSHLDVFMDILQPRLTISCI